MICYADHRFRPGHQAGPQRSGEDIDRYSRVRGAGDSGARARRLLHRHVGRGRALLRAVSVTTLYFTIKLITL